MPMGSDEPRQDEDELVFQETVSMKKVSIVNEKDRSKTPYVLVEMGSDGVERWMKFQTSRLAGGGNRGRPDITKADFRDYTATLISYCLFERKDGDELAPGKSVPIEVIRNWPASTLNGLYEICETMNALNDEGKEKAKKA